MIKALCPVGADVRAAIKGAIAHDRSAEYLLGLTLLTGEGLPRDRVAGMIWVVRAAEQGEQRGARYCGPASQRRTHRSQRNQDRGRAQAAGHRRRRRVDARSGVLSPYGVKQDLATGLGLLKQAVDKGSSDAEKDLSQLYLNGAPGLPANRPEAMKWLAVSAGHGNVEAMLSLGYMSMNSAMGAPSSTRNLALGYCWLMRAAMMDHAQAHEKLSMIFATGEKDDHGTTIPIDLVQADRWFRLAARSPYHDNSQIRSMIEPKMTTEQLNEAKRLVETWHPLTVQELRGTAIALPGAPGRSCPAMT